MRPRAVLFDFDGVLVDSMPLHLVAWADAVRKLFGVPLNNPLRLAGHATRTIAHILATEHGKPAWASALVALKEERLLGLEAMIRPLPGALEACRHLRETRIPFGIASNSTRSFIQKVLAAPGMLGLTSDAVVTIDDVRKGKPDPEIYREGARRLGVIPGERGQVLIFEDSREGLAAARAAGMLAIGVATTLPAAELLAAGAQDVCQDLAQALQAGWLATLPEPS